MHEFRVWAPHRGRVELALGEQRIPMARADGGWWECAAGEGGSGRAGPGTDYAFSLDGGPPRPDPRSASQPDGVHGPSRVVDHDGLRLARQRLARACRWRDRSSTSCTSARSRPRAPSTAAIAHLDHLVELGVDRIELMPVAEFPGRPGLGLRRRRPVRPAPRLRRPGRPEAARRRGHAPRARRGARRRLQPPRPGRELPAGVRPVLHGPPPDPLGRRGQLRRPGQRRGAAVRHRQRPDVAARLPRATACASTPCTRSSTTPPSTSSRSWPPRSTRWPPTLGRPLFVDRRERPATTRAASAAARPAATASTPRGPTTGTTPCTPCSPASRTATTRTSARSPLLAKALRQAWVYDGTYSPHRQRVPRPLADRAAGQPVRGLHPEPRPGRQPRRGRAPQRPDERGPAASGRGPAADLARSCRCCSRARSGAPARPFQYFTDHDDPELGPGGQRGAARGVRRLRLGPRRRARSRRIRRPSSAPSSTGPSRSRTAHAGLLAWYRELISLRRRRPELTDPRLGRVETDIRSSGRVADRPARPGRGRRQPRQRSLDLPGQPGDALLAASDPRVVRSRQGIALPPDTVAIVTEADVS